MINEHSSPNPTAQANTTGSLSFVRLSMILSGLSPLFILWALRGMKPVPDKWLGGIAAALVVGPNIVLLLRILVARKEDQMNTLTVEYADDHKDHLLVYLFAMLIPLFDANIGTTRDTLATCFALILVVFLFWHLNLHYMNLLFALCGYRVFTIRDSGGTLMVLLSTRSALPTGATITGYRLSDTVYLEKNK